MLKLFSGTANPKLSKEVSKKLDIPLSRAEIVRFANSEVRVTLQEDVKNTTCVVIQPTSNPTDTHLMELFLFCDALRRQEAKKVVGVIPYFGYARQDIQHREGECLSAHVVIRFLESVGFFKIYTVELHDEATQGVFSIPFKNISALALLAEEVKKYLKTNIDTKHIAIVSPDQGGLERARDFGEHLFDNDNFSVAVIEKKRNLNAIHMSKALNLYGNVKGKTAIFVDDMITSGGTLGNAVALCKERGADKILTAIVHHDFTLGAQEKLKQVPIDVFFTTNTISLEQNKLRNLREISVASLIANELKYLK